MEATREIVHVLQLKQEIEARQQALSRILGDANKAKQIVDRCMERAQTKGTQAHDEIDFLINLAMKGK